MREKIRERINALCEVTDTITDEDITAPCYPYGKEIRCKNKEIDWSNVI